MNSYTLTRRWFDYAFEHTECKVYHTALFCWIIELNNRLGWKTEFGLPTQDTMEGLSIGNKNTYLNALRDLSQWGFIKIVKESKNQYQACVISICYVISETAQYTALDTALVQHDIQHCNNTEHSTDTSIGATIVPIDKPLNHETIKPLNQEVVEKTRLEKFDEAIEGYFESQHQSVAEKEKSSAQKEKEIPALEVAIAKMPESTMWRNAVQHYKISEPDRDNLFKVFYEQKEDAYKNKFPTWQNMCTNFYWWISTIKRLGKLELYLNPNGTENNTVNQNTGKSRTRNHTAAKDERSDLAAKSTEFLQQFTNQIINPGNIQQQ